MRYCRRMVGFRTSPPCRTVRNLRLVALFAWSSALVVLSLGPEVRAPAGLQVWDKFSHFAAYAVLALLLLRTLLIWQEISPRLRLITWLACMAYGLLLEALQWLMAAGRQWESGDLLANGCGALAVCVLFRHVCVRASIHGP